MSSGLSGVRWSWMRHWQYLLLRLHDCVGDLPGLKDRLRDLPGLHNDLCLLPGLLASRTHDMNRKKRQPETHQLSSSTCPPSTTVLETRLGSMTVVVTCLGS
jgi:hypothetical protein